MCYHLVLAKFQSDLDVSRFNAYQKDDYLRWSSVYRRNLLLDAEMPLWNTSVIMPDLMFALGRCTSYRQELLAVRCKPKPVVSSFGFLVWCASRTESWVMSNLGMPNMGILKMGMPNMDNCFFGPFPMTVVKRHGAASGPYLTIFLDPEDFRSRSLSLASSSEF